MTEREWKTARKIPIEVEWRGPFTDTDVIETIEGDFEIDKEYIEQHGGYVIIRGIDGEKYPCGLDIFNETYIDESVRGEPQDIFPLVEARRSIERALQCHDSGMMGLAMSHARTTEGLIEEYLIGQILPRYADGDGSSSDYSDSRS